ncbi:MBOAT-domain-containing protein [Lactarius deliciosus]|nr:MBOAT-domain-containing protein [Lactarius deliciosus]
MVYIPIEVSSKTLPNYDLYRHRLANGWLPGSEVYHSFRTNLPALAALMAAFFALKYAYTRPILRDSSLTSNRIPIMRVLIILSANYVLAKTTGGTQLAVLVTWLFNGGVLLANEWYGAYAFATLHTFLVYRQLPWWHGVYPRWHVSFDITVLRLVSFSIDYHWACNHIGITDVRHVCLLLSSAWLYSTCAPHTPLEILAYALHAPLYIAGPILTFNDFMWQLPRPKEIPPRATARYAVRDTHAWIGMLPAQLSMVGFWNLIFVWVKLLLPWHPPENMVRCVANNYSVLGFWRARHRSYNLWIVRHLYIPRRHAAARCHQYPRFHIRRALPRPEPQAVGLGLARRAVHPAGSRGEEGVPAVSSACLRPRLSGRFCGDSQHRVHFDSGGAHHVGGGGGMCNVLLMMGANLLGFVLGVDGAQYFARRSTVGLVHAQRAGIRFLFGAYARLFVGVQLMFEYREEELRRGIQR